MSHRRWSQAGRPLLIGLTVGVVFSMIDSRLPTPWDGWALIAFLLVVIAFVGWLFVSTRRDLRQLDEQYQRWLAEIRATHRE